MIKLMGVNSVCVFLLLSLLIIKAQEYVILDELEPDIWDLEEDNPIAEAEKALSALCENYPLAVNNQELDCSNLELKSRDDLLGENYHVLHKREVGDNELEDGSGVGEPLHPEASNQNSTATASVATPQTVPESRGSSVNSSDSGQPAESPVEKFANIVPEISSNNVDSNKEEIPQNNQTSSTTTPADTPNKDPEAKPAVDPSDSDKTEGKDDQPAEAAIQKGEDTIPEISINNLEDINEDKQVASSVQNTTVEENKDNEKLAEASLQSNVDTSLEAAIKSSNNEGNAKESEKYKDEVQESQLPLNNQTSTPIAITSTNSVKPLAAVEQKVDEAPVDTNNLTVSLREPQGGNMDFEIQAANADLQEASNKNETKEEELNLQKELNGEEKKETPQNPKAPETNPKDSSAIEKVFEAAANETEKLEKDQNINNEEVSSPSSTTHDIPRHQTTILPPIHTSEATAINETEKLNKGQTAKNENVSTTHSIPRHETTIAPPVQSSEAISSTSAGAPTVDKKELETATKKVLPSDLAEVDSTTNSKPVELINDQQSGNAVMFKEPKFGAKASIEASDSEKHLASLATNAKVSNASDSDEPNTGESAKAVSKAGKDTTILVVLFVVVIVVGAAAFTHNFIKKRKQNAAQNSDIVNGIRRSLQNLTSGNEKNSTDVEQGTEMKPLMKTNSPVMVKEYSDTKKEAEA